MTIENEDQIEDVSTPEVELELASEDTSTPEKAESGTSKEEIDQLRAQMEEARKEREAEKAAFAAKERELEELRQRQLEESRHRVTAEEAAYSNAILVAENTAAQLEKDMAEAMAVGEYAKAASLQRQIATAQFKAEALKAQFEQRKALAQQQPTQQQDDALANVSPATRAWLQAHPEVLSNQRMGMRAQAAHFEAVADGLTPDTPAYFEFVETKLGYRQPAQEETAEVAVEKPVQRASTVARAAPPSRASVPGVAPKRQAVKLSAAEQEIAVSVRPDLPPEEAYKRYAMRKQELIANGEI